MSDDEVIRFQITDYDLDNEFNPNRGRRGKKEDQIYGVWAKDSDEEDNEDNIRQHVRKPKDYAAPIGFVAGGFQQAGKKKDLTKKDAVELSEPSSSMPQIVDSSSDEDRPPAPDESETAGIRKAGRGMRPPQLVGNLGSWERHTKGIGAKLLLQMGYQPGRGLGKDLQGISAPVEATVRKGRGAIGAYGPEKAALKAKREEEQRQLEKNAEEKETQKSYHWKKSHKGRYFYRDAADVIQEGKPSVHTIASNELARVPVIDMTGKEKRVLSGYHALRSAAPRFEHEPRRRCENFSAPELTHNLEIMVECCEQDIIQNARELHMAEDEIVVIERDLEDCNKKLAEHDKIITIVQDILERIEELNKVDTSLDKIYDILIDVKQSYPLEYDMFGLGTVGGTVISPLLSTGLAGWDLLQTPELPVHTFLKWRPLLTTDAYNTLLWQHFVPKMTAAAETWNPRVPTPMLKALETWTEACPPWVRAECVTRCVLPRLVEAARAWDPTCDTQPIHVWILPWHEIAGEALSATVYPMIRSRLATALSAWHPADASARPLLAAWRDAWGPALTALLHRHVLPKLEACLQAAPIELVGRENTAWLWCVEWTELAGVSAVGGLAARALLPRWLAALAAWLNTAPAHATVLKSYTDFKKMFPDEILREPAVRDAFRKALDMMNRSADIDMIEPPPPPRFTIEPKETARLAEVIGSANQQKSFSELLESRCIERGITYVPIVGRSREGRPLYRIGNTMQCFVIRNVIMYSNDSGRTFLPISMDKLLNMAEE